MDRIVQEGMVADIIVIKPQIGTSAVITVVIGIETAEHLAMLVCVFLDTPDKCIQFLFGK